MAGHEISVDETRGGQTPRRTWNDASAVVAWDRWHDKMVIHHANLTQALLRNAKPFLGARVLDLASGVGDPAMQLARRVGLTGSVVASDFSPAMVAALQEKLFVAGVDNAEARVADACNLPFADKSFDIATSKLGVAYFFPLGSALQEVRRVLRTGGHFSMIAWGMPEIGNYFNSCILPFVQRSHLPPPAQDDPSPLRFSPPGSAAKAIMQAGFHDVTERRKMVEMSWPGPPEELFRQLHDTSVSLRPYFDELSPNEYVEAHAQAMDQLGKLYDGKSTRNTVEIVIASGTA